MYCNNNPIVFLHPDGRDMITFKGTDAAALVKTIQGTLETGGAWSIQLEWATGSLYAEKDVYDAFEGSGGGGFGVEDPINLFKLSETPSFLNAVKDFEKKQLKVIIFLEYLGMEI